MMKGTVMFASLLVTGESLTCTGSDDPSAPCYSGSDLGETVDVKRTASLVRLGPST